MDLEQPHHPPPTGRQHGWFGVPSNVWEVFGLQRLRTRKEQRGEEKKMEELVAESVRQLESETHEYINEEEGQFKGSTPNFDVAVPASTQTSTHTPTTTHTVR